MQNQKLSHVFGCTNTPLLEITIGELLESASLKYPKNTAVISSKQNISWSYERLNQEASKLARGFISIGLSPGERIGIWSPNNIEWITTMYAAAKAGLILVNINPAYRPNELEYALKMVGCNTLVLATKFKTSNYLEMIQELVPEIKDCRPGQLKAKRLPDLRSLILIENLAVDGFYRYSDVQDLGATESLELKEISEKVSPVDPVNIQFTSGTTGSPKGATLAHINVVNNAYFVGLAIGLNPSERVCSPVPLYHCFGMVMATLACANHGASLVLPGESFDPVSTLEAIEKERCTALYGVPTMFNMILEHPLVSSFDVASLRTGIVGGALCPKTLMKSIISELNMHDITNCYGMTETSPVSFQSATNDSLEKRITTVGRVHPNVEAKVIDAQGAIVPRNCRGELCTKGYSVMSGYWADIEKTEASIIDGWMHTGDAAVIGDDGYCSIVGRIKDTIIRGGENIAPKEIEEYLLTHRGVVDVQVYGVSDLKFGEIVAANIKLREDVVISADEIQEYCQNQIANFKIPAIVKFVEEFPLTVTGKIQKYVMRNETEEERGI